MKEKGDESLRGSGLLLLAVARAPDERMKLTLIDISTVLLLLCQTSDRKKHSAMYLTITTESTGMEDYRRQGGIQQLLVAEQEARQIVNTARTAKLNRLKQAKNEADEEVAKYRAHMEKEFQKTISESSGFSGTNVKRLDQETVTKIDQLKKQAAKVSPEVVKMLMNHVTSIKI
ncbi:hypothetical protein LXL04_000280 [Taraxacum kok-saghyz]